MSPARMKREKLQWDKTARNPKNIRKQLRTMRIELFDRNLLESDDILFKLFQNTED